MKRTIAVLLIIVLMACGCTAAFAETHAVMIWSEELHAWVIEVIYDEPEITINPDWRDYLDYEPPECPVLPEEFYEQLFGDD